jgi:hypothetical protein
VGLDAVHREDAIGTGGVEVEIERHAVGSSCNDNCFHRRSNLSANGGFCNAVVAQYLALSIGRGATVRTHGRHDEWRHAKGAESSDDPD